MGKRRKDERARRALAELLNLTLEGKTAYSYAEAFLSKYEPLTPNSAMPEADAVEYARRLREIWDCSNSKTRPENAELWTAAHRVQAANASLDDLFKAGDPIRNEGPAVAANIKARALKPRPRTFLHALSLELLYFPKSIGRCRQCGRFFVKTSSRDGYCPPKFNREGIKVDCERVKYNERQKILMRKIRKGE